MNDLGRRAGDLLAFHLGKSGEFIVLHDRDGNPPRAANALISGSVVEFDKARAKVAFRMVDPANGAILFSDSGEAETRKAPLPDTALGGRHGEGLGPDAALQDQALEAAIVKLAARLAATLRSRPWRASILEAAQGKVVIAAGTRSGIRPGQELRIIRPGRQVKEPTSGLVLELPGEEVGRIKVVSQSGTGEWDESSVCAVLSGKGFARTDYVSLEEGL